ncbi:unnamed protein product [Rotaria sp. Silwood2]|nr:unnamed protein product [Rotaria sp. Silwood2]
MSAPQPRRGRARGRSTVHSIEPPPPSITPSIDVSAATTPPTLDTPSSSSTPITNISVTTTTTTTDESRDDTEISSASSTCQPSIATPSTGTSVRGRGRPIKQNVVPKDVVPEDPYWTVTNLTNAQFHSNIRPTKPDELGTLGKQIQVIVNYFPILQFPHKYLVYKYHIQIRNKKDFEIHRERRRYPQIDRHKIVYDNQSTILVFDQPLPNIDENTVAEDIKGPNRSNRQELHKVIVRKAGCPVDLAVIQNTKEIFDTENLTNYTPESLQNIKQILSIVLHEHCSNHATFIYNRCFFSSTTDGSHGEWDLGLGKALWRGFYSCLVFAKGKHKLLMNLDVKHTVFMKKQPFLEFLCEIMLHSPCGKRKYARQRNVSKADGEDVLRFLDINNPTYRNEIDFLLKHCKHLRVRSQNADKPITYEISQLGNSASTQNFEWKTNKNKTVTVEQYPSLPVLQMRSGSYLPMELVDVEPVRVKKITDDQRALLCKYSSIVPPVYCKSIKNIRENPKQQCFEEDPFVAAWNLNVGTNMLTLPARILPMPEIVYTPQYRVTAEAVRDLGTWEMKPTQFHKPATFPSVWGLINLSSLNQQACEDFSNELCAVAQQRETTSEDVVESDNVSSDKINRFFSRGHRIMYVGADLSHAAPSSGNQSSVVAVVASADDIPNCYFKEVYQQLRPAEARGESREYIVSMKEIMKSLIQQYALHQGYPPTAIVIYRDGISEGEFDSVFEKELMAIREACVDLSPVYRPYITYIVVNKKHHTRLFPINSEKNVAAGTILDSHDITTATTYDFYLNSQHGALGTSRPTHYHVLYDDNKLQPDEVQMLTYALCYTYARCTRSVSIPAPVKYADLLALRATYYINNNDDSDTESVASGPCIPINQDTEIKNTIRSERIVLSSKIAADCPFFLYILMTKIISKFEHLPNELLLDILAYCRPRDLFISLFNLNQRLNTLIYSQSVNIDLGNALPKYLLDVYYKSVLYNAREQIYCLRLSDTYGRMNRFVINAKQLDIDFEIRKSILNRVKYLILWDPVMTSLYEILNYVNNLEYFHVTSIGTARQTPNFSERLLKRLFEMKTLKRLYLALHDSIIFNTDIDINTSLVHLTLNGCYMQHLAPLLRRLPNIRKLNIMCYNRPNLFSINPENFDYSLYDGLADCVPYLTHLILHVTHTPFFEIKALLQQLSKLIKLSFSSLLIEEYSNGLNWENIITKYLPNLQKFSLFINEAQIPTRTQVDLIKMIQSFSSPFWHRWPVVIEYYIDSISKKHLMLYTLPSQKDSIRTYLYGVQTQTAREIFDDDHLNCNKVVKNLDYKKVYELHFTLHSNPPSNVLLPNRIYTNLKSLSFSSELTDPGSYDADIILNDLKEIFSTSVLANIKRIYLYNRIYPINFLSRLLNLLPNVQSLRIDASLFNISTVFTRITSLTVDLNSNVICKTTDILRQMGTFLPNIRYLYLELKNAQDIYILLVYCLRKLEHLLDIHITLHEPNVRIDQQAFISWFNDYKLLNGLNNKVQVEFGGEDNRLHISL